MPASTFTLLILLYGAPSDANPTLATVPGFTSEIECAAAGHHLERRPRDYIKFECIEVR